MKLAKSRGETFDASYYARYYERPTTRVHGAAEVDHLCRGVASLLDWWKFPVRSVLDIGAGTGLWRDWFRVNRPDVAYRSTEYSRYACERYGHEHRNIATWCEDSTFDLVVCQGVLPYLDARECSQAIRHIKAMSGGFLYLEAITRRDLRVVVDDAKTDIRVFPRSGTWYRARLAPRFRELGCGLWVTKPSPVLFYELERPRQTPPKLSAATP